jgi:hypothetical protein
MFTKSKKILTIAVAAVALTTASFAVTGDALAKGGMGGGGFGKGGGFGHGHGFGRGFGHGGVVFIGSSCWRWFPGLGKVWVCD